jgi:hypothetical protein
LIRAAADQIVSEFAENLRREISESAAPDGTTGPSQQASSQPISGFGLIVRTLMAWLRDKFSRRPTPQ